MFIAILILILLASFPIGYLLAWLTRDELVSGRKWFILLFIASLVISLIVAFLQFSGKIAVIISLFYIAIVSLISVYKSYDRKFVK